MILQLPREFLEISDILIINCLNNFGNQRLLFFLYIIWTYLKDSMNIHMVGDKNQR